MHSSGAPEPAFLVGFFVLYGFFILLMIGLFVLWIVELVDCVRREFPEPNDKIVWVLVIALGHGIGAIIYYCIGRQRGHLPGTAPPKQM